MKIQYKVILESLYPMIFLCKSIFVSKEVFHTNASFFVRSKTFFLLFEIVHGLLSFPCKHWHEFFLLVFTSVKYCEMKLLKPERCKTQWKGKHKGSMKRQQEFLRDIIKSIYCVRKRS